MDPSPDELEGVDRARLSLVPYLDEDDERAFWRSRTPAERLRHVEMLRRINYGDRAVAPMDKVLELVPMPWLRKPDQVTALVGCKR